MKCDHIAIKREYYDNCRTICMKCRAVLVVRIYEEIPVPLDDSDTGSQPAEKK